MNLRFTAIDENRREVPRSRRVMRVGTLWSARSEAAAFLDRAGHKGPTLGRGTLARYLGGEAGLRLYPTEIPPAARTDLDSSAALEIYSLLLPQDALVQGFVTPDGRYSEEDQEHEASIFVTRHVPTPIGAIERAWLAKHPGLLEESPFKQSRLGKPRGSKS